MANGNLNAAVARLIRARRVEIGLSQEALAHLCGLDRTYISSLERGHRNVTLLTIERIIPHLQITTEEFFIRALLTGVDPL